MGWWKLTYDLSEQDRIKQVLSQLEEAVLRFDGGEEFFREILLNAAGIPRFFQHMFQSEGAYANQPVWKSLRKPYLSWKISRGYNSRRGMRTGNLFRSFTQPGSSDSIVRISPDRAEVGSAVRDNEQGMFGDAGGGKAYSGHFNQKRPVLNREILANLALYITRGEGKPVFTVAANKLKAAVIKSAVSGWRRNRWGNIFPQ
jgi:hypothetical protein